MKKYAIIYLPAVALALLFSTSCQREVWNSPASGRSSMYDSTISGALKVEGESATATKSPIATKALVDQVTTRQLNSNFLRLDEDIDDESGEGLGTYKYGKTVNTNVYYPKAYILLAAAIASPDNSSDYLRSVTFNPSQSYKLRVKTYEDNTKDTTQFYHTRMIGWYPRTCNLAVVDGDAVVEQFETEYSEGAYETDSDGRVAIKFKNLTASDDLMVSDLCEAQQWHSDDPTKSPHTNDASNLPYCMPFGSNTEHPGYANFFTYRHYRSAIMLFAEADNSPQNLAMWGKILKVTIANQATDCKVWLPENVGEFGTCEWDETSRTSIQIDSTAIFGNDTNHSDIAYTAHYPISLEGVTTSNKAYLGYALIEPDQPVTVQIHTTSGVYSVKIDNTYTYKEDGETKTVPVFQRSYYYPVTLSLQTTGAIAEFLEAEDEDRFYDLTTIKEVSDGVYDYPYANCYIVDPDCQEIKDALDALNAADGTSLTEYDGYTFCAVKAGNGDAGVLNSSFYPSSADLNLYSARLIWESSRGLVSDIEFVHEYIRFKHKKADGEGNAVIGGFDSSGNLIWSWHIWFTDKPADIEFGSTTFMDRNLGATAADPGSDPLQTYGLYYQWGRKDPSMGPRTYNTTIACLNTSPYFDYTSEEYDAAEVKQFSSPTVRNGVENPLYLILPSNEISGSYAYNWITDNNTMLWGYDASAGTMNKSIYDPCPFGYRVPAGELYDNISSRTATSAGTYGITYTNGNDLFFPYAGFKGDDVNSNTVSCAWMQVGVCGDIQTARVSTTSGDSYFHRERLYCSQQDSWSNLVGSVTNSYYSNTNLDYTNRRTAASVRCVKDTDYGDVDGSLAYTSSAGATVLKNGDELNFTVTANSNGCKLNQVKVDLKYEYDGGEVETNVYNYSGTYGVNLEDAFVYTISNDLDLTKVSSAGFTFTLTVANESGMSRTRTVTIGNPAITLESITLTDPANEPDFPATDWQNPFKGQYTSLNLILDVKASSAVINSATVLGTINSTSSGKSGSGTDSDPFVFNVKFENSSMTATAGSSVTIPVSIEFTIDGSTVEWTYNYTAEVWAQETETTVDYSTWEVGSTALTSSTIGSYDYFVMNNSSYTGYYVAANSTSLTGVSTTSFDATGTDRSCWWSANYTSETNASTIQNVSTGTYLYLNATRSSGNNWTYSTPALSSSTNSLTMTYSSSYWTLSQDFSSQGRKSTYTTTAYLCQSSNTGYTSGNSTSNSNYSFYPVQHPSTSNSWYADPNISGNSLSPTTATAGTSFTASYTFTVNDASSVSVTSAEINGVTASSSVSGNTVTLTATVSLPESGTAVPLPISVTMSVDGKSECTQWFYPTVNVQ